jgi:hypothetical protein
MSALILYIINKILFPLKLIQKVLAEILLTLHLLVREPTKFIPYFYKKWSKSFIIYIISFKKFLQSFNFSLNLNSILYLSKLLYHLIAFLGISVIFASFLNPITDITFKEFKKIFLVPIKSFLDNISQWIDSITNTSEKLNDIDSNKDLFIKQNEQELKDMESNLRKSYNFNKIESTVEVDPKDPKDSNNLSNYTKHFLVLAGVIVIGGILYYYKDSIISYISTENKTNTDLIDISTPTNSPTSTNSSTFNEESYKKFFKSPNYSPSSSLDINFNDSPSSSSSSLTIKPDNYSNSLPNSPESIVIKSDSPEPKKILLRISKERLKSLENNDSSKDLSPLISPFDNE